MKSACITGADRGLGHELVRRLLQKGYRVFAGQYEEDGTALASLAGDYPESFHQVRLDISNDRSVAEAAARISETVESLDLLINNAAVLGDIRATVYDPLDYDEMLRVYNVNALGPLRMTNALIGPILRSEDKLIVNISSEAGSIGDCWRGNWFAYSMSKAALNMQTALLHNQLKDTGAQVMSVHPGWVKTNMQGKLDTEATYTPAESARHILETITRTDPYRKERASFVDLLGNPLPW
jgi:NAD(P)-dependent dehydrogenase (short-subunit alcohol dehydrogenase family)